MDFPPGFLLIVIAFTTSHVHVAHFSKFHIPFRTFWTLINWIPSFLSNCIFHDHGAAGDGDDGDLDERRMYKRFLQAVHFSRFWGVCEHAFRLMAVISFRLLTTILILHDMWPFESAVSTDMQINIRLCRRHLPRIFWTQSASFLDYPFLNYFHLHLLFGLRSWED